MNCRAVMTSAISARRGRQRLADAGPVEKFSIAGTRPSACSAKNVTSDGARGRQQHADAFAGARARWARHRTEREACRSRARDSSAAATRCRRRSRWPPPCCSRASSSASNSVVSMRAVANIDCTISSRERAAQRGAARAAGHAVRRGQHAAAAARECESSAGDARRTLPGESRERRELRRRRCAPSTQRSAFVRSAITAGPS